jgi:predicted nucleic acid-binding protein
MFLIDTNIFLEYILRRSRVQEVKDFSLAQIFAGE